MKIKLPKWFYQLASPRWFYNITSKLSPWFAAVAFTLMLVGAVWGLAFAPADYQQGNSFRIIYIHVPTAILAQSCGPVLESTGLLVFQ